MKICRHALAVSLPLALGSLLLFSGCSLVPRFNAKLPGDRAFIVYWPPDPQSKQLKLAVKDNIDVLGVASHSGLRALHARPSERDATAVKRSSFIHRA